MRLIDADALIEKLNGIWDCNDMTFAPVDGCCIDADCKSCRWRETIEYVKRLVQNQPAASLWRRVEEPPKWVSVFDDLPRRNAVVVVSDGKRSWDVGQYHFLFKADDRTIWWWKKHTTRKVLWWMYKEDALPEPPQEVQDADT